jgi:uncharacterized protein YaaR (DUF327 family)
MPEIIKIVKTPPVNAWARAPTSVQNATTASKKKAPPKPTNTSTTSSVTETYADLQSQMSKIETENAQLRQKFATFNIDNLRKELLEFVTTEINSSMQALTTQVRDTVKEATSATVNEINTKFDTFSNNILTELHKISAQQHQVPYQTHAPPHFQSMHPHPYYTDYHTQPTSSPPRQAHIPPMQSYPSDQEQEQSPDHPRQARSPRGSTGSSPPSKQSRNDVDDDAMIHDAPPPDIAKRLLH